MFHVKRAWLFAIVVAMAVVMAASGSAFAESGKTLKLAFIAPPPVWGPFADKYAEEVAKLAPGLTIQSFGGGQLGPLQKNFAEMKMGKLDMMLCDSGVISMPKGGEPFNVVFAPYAFDSQAHIRKFFNSDLFKELMAQTEKEAGIKYIGWVTDRSPRLITTSNRKVVVPADMKGLKMRVPMTPPIIETMQAWGATPIPLSAAELYMAMQQGTVDGQDNGFDAIYGAKYYEVQKYVSPIDYIRSGLIVLVSEATWKKLSAAEKDALVKACAPTDVWGTAKTEQIVEEAMKGVVEKGMTILEPDLEAFKAIAIKTINEKLDGSLWPKGLYSKVRDLK
jgi:TRAP-type C4-dicarboxylate transport system substrate-binding protein